MNPEEIQKTLNEMTKGVPYVFACVFPESNTVVIAKVGDIGVCATLQMYIASQILTEMQNIKPVDQPPVAPPANTSLDDLLKQPAKDLN